MDLLAGFVQLRGVSMIDSDTVIGKHWDIPALYSDGVTILFRDLSLGVQAYVSALEEADETLAGIAISHHFPEADEALARVRETKEDL